MIEPPGKGILSSGGGGRLGQELQALLPGIVAPRRSDMDILDADAIESAIVEVRPKMLLHAAAYTDVARAEHDRKTCWNVNVKGTQNMVQAAFRHQLPLVHISTDYVFWGDVGNYREEDPPGPVRNYYSLSKLAAEASVQALPRHLVIRTSFRPREWAYPKAFTDLYTSQDYVDVIAPDIALVLQHFDAIDERILHIAGRRTSVYELARRRAPEVQAARKEEAAVPLPDDISLNCERWHALRKTLVD